MTEPKQGGGWRDIFFIEYRTATRISGFTGGILMQMAEEAVAAGDHKRHHHAVANRHIGYGTASFHHFTHKFMTKYIAMFSFWDLTAI